MNPEPVSERTPIFRNIHISNLVGTKINTAVKILGLEEMPVSDVTLSNIHIQSATGLNIDRAKNINLNNVRIDASKGIPFVLSHIDNAILTNVSTGLPSASVPVISISDSKEIFIRGCFPLAGNKAFLHLQGENNDIILMNNYLKRLPQIVDKESKGSKNGLIVE
jgi:hypothetical protein